MHILIVAVGKLKEKYLLAAQEEYARRIRPYARLEIKEVPERGAGDRAKEEEGKAIRQNIKPDSYVIALDRAGEETDSPGLAGKINRLGIEGKSRVVFIIGGPLGLSEEVLQKADWTLSFSRLTFPHRLARIILLEQVYRCFKIIRGEPYHR